MKKGAGRRAVSKLRHGLGEKDYRNRKKIWTLAMREPRHADLSAFLCLAQIPAIGNCRTPSQ